jgi:hypothetical protein
MGNPMKTFVTDDGRTFLIPGDEQRTEADQMTLAVANLCHPGVACECHAKMGNDFWFLPMGACLRKDRKCNHGKSD